MIALGPSRALGRDDLAGPRVSPSCVSVGPEGLIMSTPFPSTSPFGPAGPTGTSYGMGAEGGLPTPLPPACSASQAPMTPAQHATMDPAFHAFHQMAAGPWVPQNNQHAIPCAQPTAHPWSASQFGPTHPPQHHSTMLPPTLSHHGYGYAPTTYGYGAAAPSCCSSPMMPHGPMSPVPFFTLPRN